MAQNSNHLRAMAAITGATVTDNPDIQLQYLERANYYINQEMQSILLTNGISPKNTLNIERNTNVQPS